jgi:tetratricopeptide (TPR) repeat protein
MSFRYPQPSNEDDFELFCLRFLRELWHCPTLQQYGKRGERQDGVDLIDEAGGPPLRAVQCKHHEPDKTVPPAEIQGEVTKALGSSLPLDEYYILSTARKTTQGQNAVIRINRDHQGDGRFKVFLWTWADIEERLAQMDDATQDRVLRGDSGRSGPAVSRLLAGVMNEHFDRPLYSSSSVLDLEIEAIKGSIKRHELEVAESKLKEIETRAADKLQPHHWYDIKAARSKLFSDRWEWEKAGRELLDAKRFMPDSERARINESLGYELIGNRDKAHTIATELRKEYPLSARLLAVWVRTTTSDTPFATLVEVASTLAKDDEELNLALAHRALAEDRFEEALPYARRAAELDAESPHAWFILGQAQHAAGCKHPRGSQKALLQEAEEHYNQAARLAHDQKWPGLEAVIRFNRGKLRHALGGRNADADFSVAVELGRPDLRLRTEYAGYLLEMGRHEDALRELAAAPAEETTARLFFEAAALHARNVGDDRTRAVGLLHQVLASEPAERWADAHIFLVQWAVESKQYDPARVAITRSKLREVDPFVFHILSGWLAGAEGNTEIARAEYKEALELTTDETPRGHLFLLGQALAAVGDDEAALPLFLRTYQPGVFNFECRKLLGCAQRLERHEVASRLCRELREAGETDPRIILTEIQILQRYDPHEALRLAQGHLGNHPDDRHVALWQSALALRLGRRDLIISDITRFPEPADLTPQGSGVVLSILSETGQPAAALRYAYEALRAHFDSEFAHGQFVTYFLQLSSRCPELRVGGTAKPGMAVRYREENEEADRWLIIEDAEDPDLSRGEFGPEHPFSRALSGRQVGQSVVVSDGAVQPRTATIREALHKYIYRFRDCMNQFQVRFPGASAVQVVHVGHGDQFDPSAIITTLEKRRKHVEDLDELYRTQPLPLYTYADLVGRDEFEAWGHLVSSPNLGIRCWNEQMEDQRTALDQVRESKAVVIDISALCTLAHLGLLKVLCSPGRSFAVAQATFDRLQHLVERAEDDKRAEGSLHVTRTGSLGYVPVTPEERDRYVAFLGNLRDTVRQSCQVLPCPQAAELDPKRRGELTETLGRHNLHSMLISATPGTTFWTDDLILGIVGRAEFRTTRVWTQAVLFHLQKEGAITQQEFDGAVAKLIGWHYHSTQCNSETLIAAAEIAEWDTTRWPVPQVMQTLGNDMANPVHRIAVAASAVRSVWQRDLPLQVRQGFLFAVVDGLKSLRLVRRFLQVMPGLFSLDVFSAAEVQDCIGYWMRNPTGIVRP